MRSPTTRISGCRRSTTSRRERDREINWPAKNRFNAGFDFSYQRLLGNLSVNLHRLGLLAGRARCAIRGHARSRTRIVNAGIGVRWAREKLVTSLKVNNLANEEVQQHIFGDIVKRQVVGEARFTF